MKDFSTKQSIYKKTNKQTNKTKTNKQKAQRLEIYGGIACTPERVNRLTRRAGRGRWDIDSETGTARDK